jgi:hypothetical protein
VAIPTISLYTQADVDALIARWRAIPALLAALGAAGDISDQGRSISTSATRNALLAEQKQLLEMIVAAAGPFSVATRMRPGG